MNGVAGFCRFVERAGFNISNSIMQISHKAFHTLLLSILVIFCSCTKQVKPVVPILDISSGNDWVGDTYSIKVYSNGTIFMEKHFWDHPVMRFKKTSNIAKLESIINKAQTANLPNRYNDPVYKDDPFYNVIFYYDNSKSTEHHVNGGNYPSILQTAIKYCDSLADTKGWTELKDTTIKFESLANLVPKPKIKVDQVKFPPPVVGKQ